MNAGIVSFEIDRTIEELFEDLSARELQPTVQTQIREGLASTICKGILAAIGAVKGTSYLALAAAYCAGNREIIECLSARDPGVAELSLTALSQVKAEIRLEISDRLAVAVEAGVA